MIDHRILWKGGIHLQGRRESGGRGGGGRHQKKFFPRKIGKHEIVVCE